MKSIEGRINLPIQRTIMVMALSLLVLASVRAQLTDLNVSEEGRKSWEKLVKDYPTPLLRCVVLNEVSVLRAELRRGASVNVPSGTPSRQTPILLAATGSREEILSILVQNGADVDTRDEQGRSALMYSSVVGSLRQARLLLDAGASPRSTDSLGTTALMFAAVHGHLSVVQLLLARGSDVNARGPDQSTALMLASDDIPVLKALIKAGAHLDDQDNLGRTAVSFAIVNEQVAKVKFLIENGAEIDASDKSGETPRMLALKIRKLENRDAILRLLQ